MQGLIPNIGNHNGTGHLVDAELISRVELAD